jgi:hypothetical protein
MSEKGRGGTVPKVLPETRPATSPRRECRMAAPPLPAEALKRKPHCNRRQDNRGADPRMTNAR